MKPKLTFLIYFLLAAVSLPAQSITGTYLVGSSQPVYKKLTDVATALNNPANTVTGNVVFELDSDYDGTTGETLPITFNQFNSSGAWTVTIRPKAGVSMRTTSGDPGSNKPVILLNGTDSLVLEGRAGGTGSTIGWTIRNKHTGPNPGAAIGLQNDAKKDRLSYLQLEANPTLIDQAVVVLGSTTGPDGNDGNVVSYCNIRNRSDISSPGTYDYPGAGIISVNTTGEESRFNSGNLFEYNNISDFYYPGDSSFGICAYSGTRATTINGNSVYRTSSFYNYPWTFQAAIFIREQSSVSGTTVTNNFIGGNAPRCNGLYDVRGGEPYKFAAILFHSHQPLAGQGINQVNGNTIQSFSLYADASLDGELFLGIRVVNSAANISNNTIGKLTGPQNIFMRPGAQANFICKPIDYLGLSGSIVNNKIGGVMVITNTIDFAAISFKEVVPGTAFAITGNTIGGTTDSDSSIRIHGGEAPLQVRGIAITSDGSVNCTGNAISHISIGPPYLSGSGFTASLSRISHVLNGIMKTGTGTAIIKDNTVSELISYYFSPAEDITAPGFAGICVQQGFADTIEHNTITGLKRLRAPAYYLGSNNGVTCIAGIAVSENVYAQIDNNTIEKFESVNEAHPTTLIGIAGGSRFYNNTISLTNRNEATGTYRENNCGIIGILNNATDMYIFHNSVYVGGNNGEGTNTARSAAVQFSQATSPYVVWNNLFVNERSGGSSAHYGYYYPGEYTSTASEYNLLITAQANKLIRADNADMDSTAWKATGNDPHSTFATTAQIAPSNLFTDRFSQLEIAQPSEHYVAGKGDDLPVTKDKKYKARNDLTPSLGAYEYTVLEFTSYGGADSAAVSVAENQALAATLTAANGNAAATITYSITGGADAAQFSINSATGELSFVNAPDFEHPSDSDGDNVYVVTVQASDATYTDVQTITVTVTDVNDDAVLTITSYSGAASATVNVAENQTLVTTVTATTSNTAATIAFSLVGSDDDSYFTVNSTTGQLSFVNAPDFERPSDPDENNMYMVTVQASDGSLTATQRFKVRVTNVNDNAPEFGSFDGDAAVSLKIPENTTTVGTVWAVDKEPGTTITYSILGNNEGALFSINASTGVLRFITAPDYENPQDQYAGNVYIVSVQASDGQLTSVQRFKIKVTDVNESTGRMSSNATGMAQTVEEASTGKGISIFPNPVTGKRFTIRANDLADGKYILELYTSTGQLAYRQQLNHTGKSTSYPIQLPASLAKGMYVLKLSGAGTLHTEKLVIE